MPKLQIRSKKANQSTFFRTNLLDFVFSAFAYLQKFKNSPLARVKKTQTVKTPFYLLKQLHFHFRLFLNSTFFNSLDSAQHSKENVQQICNALKKVFYYHTNRPPANQEQAKQTLTPVIINNHTVSAYLAWNIGPAKFQFCMIFFFNLSISKISIISGNFLVCILAASRSR